MLNLIDRTGSEAQSYSIWVTIKSDFDDKVINSLLLNEHVKGVRFNLTKEPDIDLLNRKLGNIKACNPNTRIMMDFGGNKQRIALNRNSIKLRENERCKLFRVNNMLEINGIGISEFLFDHMQSTCAIGDYILISDGWQQLKIDGIQKDTIICSSVFECEICNLRGISVKGLYDSIEHDYTKDLKKYQALNYVTDIALSFSNDPVIISNMKNSLGPNVNLIAKIESQGGLKNLIDIVQAADEVMIARGDLLVELYYYGLDLLKVEEYIAQCCSLFKKPFIIATRVADTLETDDEISFEETLMLCTELRKYLKPAFLLANETSVAEEKALKNLNIITERMNMILKCQ